MNLPLHFSLHSHPNLFLSSDLIIQTERIFAEKTCFNCKFLDHFNNNSQTLFLFFKF